MFDCFFKTTFYSKCKPSIKVLKTRIELIKKKRNATEKYMRNDIAELLRNGFDVIAYQRVERLLVELDISTGYDFIEQYCVNISGHLTLMDKERECPDECKEAVSCLMYAAARFADLPELRQLRTIFSERYGKSVEYYINKEFVEKLKKERPSNEKKFQLMQDIASESGLDWNSKALENELFNAQGHGKRNGERENVSPQRNNIVHIPHKSGNKTPSTRDNKYDTSRRNEKQIKEETLTVDSDEESEEEEEESFNLENPLPPYTKSQAEKSNTDNSKAKAKDQEKAKVAQRILKFLDKEDDDPSDDNESTLDRLLLHYAGKKASNETSPKRDSIGTSKAKRTRSKDGYSRRATSLPNEVTSPQEAPEGHGRVSSQPEMLNSNEHQHLKPPDYDEFMARLASLRGK